jgi:hypothetical protein
LFSVDVCVGEIYSLTNHHNAYVHHSPLILEFG